MSIDRVSAKENKKLVVIVGPNGVGKSTTARALLARYTKSAFVDSDWCRVINPFPFTEETKETVIRNIFSLIHNYMLCKDVNHVIFTYGFHGERKNIFAEVLQRLRREGISFELTLVILKCSLNENIRRMECDGRDENRINRAIENTFHFYDSYDDPVIDTTELEVEQVVDRIAELAGME